MKRERRERREREEREKRETEIEKKIDRKRICKVRKRRERIETNLKSETLNE